MRARHTALTPRAAGAPPVAKMIKPNVMRNLLKTRALPRPGCWHRFTAADWEFVSQTLAETPAGRESLATLFEDVDTLELILASPRLFDALMERRCGSWLSPELFFLVVVRQALSRVKTVRFQVADYIAVVCADFGCRADSGPQVRDKQVSSLYSVDYLEALHNANRHERFFLHVQCANQFLVLTSLYPDFLHDRAIKRGAPDIEYYEEVVVNHLTAARDHVLADEFALTEVFEQLTEIYPLVRRALNHTAREFLSLG